MPSKQTRICLTHSIYAMWKRLCICENEATIEYYHGSKLRNEPTCCYSLIQWLVN